MSEDDPNKSYEPLRLAATLRRTADAGDGEFAFDLMRDAAVVIEALMTLIPKPSAIVAEMESHR